MGAAAEFTTEGVTTTIEYTYPLDDFRVSTVATGITHL
jgi:hypothetical protein